MEKISMVEFRKNAGAVIRKALQGKRMILTYRGRPIMRLEPLAPDNPGESDPFYAIAALADPEGESLTNREMDELIYG